MDYANKKTVEDIDVCGKRVIIRVDFNVPIKDGVIGDDSRIRAALPTINFLLEQGASVLLMSHLGRPKGMRNLDFTLRPVADRLGQLLGRPVFFAPACVGKETEDAARELRPGQVMLLENLRFYPEEEQNDPQFAAALAHLADIYVDDAFGTAHRSHASTVGITAYLPSVAGLLIQREVHDLWHAVAHPEHPFVAIIGGAKVSDKIQVIENLLKKVDKLLIGGGMANTFLAAAGYHMQASMVETERLDWAREFLQTAIAKEKLVLPVDMVAAATFSADAEHRALGVDAIPAGWMALDIGPQTLLLYRKLICGAKTIVWSGPLGVFEMDAYAAGTLGMAHAVADSGAFSVIGGGDSVSAVQKAGVTDKISHISTGGSATLKFLEGNSLPGIDALNDKDK